MRLDLKYLLRPLSFFLVCLILSLSVVIYFYIDKNNSFVSQNFAQQQLIKTRAIYLKDLELKSVYLSYEDRFNLLKNKGFFTVENRLNWIDTLESTSNKIKLPYLSYTIESRELLSDQKFNTSYPDLDLFSSSMQLDLQLLHEGDLYNLFKLLNKNAKGLFDIEMCAITRNSLHDNQLDYHENGKSFSAICKLNWYTALSAQPITPELSRRR